MNNIKDNLKYYELGRKVPLDAQTKIDGGSLKGFTDINNMWRIKMLTEMFGICGFGWYYEIIRQWKEENLPDKSCRVFCELALYIKVDNQWSKPIIGTGGNRMYYTSNGGIKVSDECYKMALSDALSVCCKALGIGADVYYKQDHTKYNMDKYYNNSNSNNNINRNIENKKTYNNNNNNNNNKEQLYRCNDCKKVFDPYRSKNKYYTSREVYELAKMKNPDNVARCKNCLIKYLDKFLK